MLSQKLLKPRDWFYIHPEYENALREIGLCSLEAVFNYQDGENLGKKNLPDYRKRMQTSVESTNLRLFLKRFTNPPLKEQLKNWLAHKRRISMAGSELKPAIELADKKVNVPEVVAFGQKWKEGVEEKSFIITKEIPDAVSLESNLPQYFYEREGSSKASKDKFIKELAEDIRNFHNTGLRHRDLYLSHIFYNQNTNVFTLIDLARCFKPLLFKKRYLLKDIAQLYYSSPYRIVSKSDKLRFYLYYTKKKKLSSKDKLFISRVKSKAERMAQHDEKRGKTPPFKNTEK